MNSMAYAIAWFWAFALTQIVECPIYVHVSHLSWKRAFLLSAVTHPCVWFVVPPLCYGVGGSYLQMVCVAELFAWTAEAALLRRFGQPWRRALGVSLLANGASVAVGMLERETLGWF